LTQEDWGRRVPHYACSDSTIVEGAVVKFCGSDDVILLTENKRRDRDGLYELLENDVAPVLNPQQHRSLVCLFRKPGTDIDRYCAGVLNFVETYVHQPGYRKLFL
jgi:hypothetical protein